MSLSKTLSEFVIDNDATKYKATVREGHMRVVIDSLSQEHGLEGICIIPESHLTMNGQASLGFYVNEEGFSCEEDYGELLRASDQRQMMSYLTVLTALEIPAVAQACPAAGGRKGYHFCIYRLD